MIGNRIRQARLASGMTLEDLAQKMQEREQPITRAGLSKYENEKSKPRQSFLMTLGQVLNVKPSYFITEPTVSVQWVAFRKQSRLSKSRQSQIKAFAAQRVERHLWLEETLCPSERPVFPARRAVNSVDDAEQAAWALREKWNLGEGPIDSLTKLIEDRGGVVVNLAHSTTQFDGLSGWANENVPVVVVNANVPDDRLRFDLGHELGHLLMDCGDVDDKEEESFAHRFASALLVPLSVIRRDLGPKRRRVDVCEFTILKTKHGVSMQCLIRRALDAGIIEPAQYRKLCIDFSAFGWRKKEPVDFHGDETPSRMWQMTQRALSEGVISVGRAEQFCPGVTSKMTMLPAKAEPISAAQLRRMRREERNRILQEAAQQAEQEYRHNRELTDFEAFSEEDLDGNDKNSL